MHRVRRSLIPLAALASTAVLFGLAGCLERGPGTPGTTGLTAGRPECPHSLSERYAAPDSFAAGLDADGNLAVPGLASNIPEFHDCQRFRVRDAKTNAMAYDSLYAVFVRFDLKQKYREWGARGDTVSIKLSASSASAPPASSPASAPAASPATNPAGAVRAGTPSGPGVSVPDAAFAGSGASTPAESPAASSAAASASPSAPPTLPNVAGGLIVAAVLAEGDYKPLGFVRGMNCVVLLRRGTEYGAYSIGVGYKDASCFDLAGAKIRSVQALSVTVLRKAQTGIDDNDYPYAARWDWDRNNDEHYVGVPCPGGWCEITRTRDYLSSVNYTSSPVDLGGAAEKRVWRGKGWYDQQHLANFAGGKPVPTGPFATTFPARKLADRDIKDYHDWKHVATVVMSETSYDYRTKYQYKASDLPPMLEKGVNVIQLCTDSLPDAATGASHRRSDDNCHVETERVARGWLTKCRSAWYARVIHDGKVRRVFCVKYRGFKHGFDIPGVVRWRWRADDETIWIRCPVGCCEMDNDT
ncbi:MAG: hypothetical protein HYX65_05015 [Gemmatimonadetes bacterium]|nr:hypothetical protein [Gemmatimonadota bacterium]